MAVKGQRVSVNYIGTFDDGTVFDKSTDHDETFDFVVGSGNVIDGFDQAVREMEVGDKRTVVIEPAHAYGEYKDELVETVGLEELADSDEIVKRVGEYICFDNEGVFKEALIKEVNGGQVTFDFNHPMAGKRLNFEIELVSVADGAKTYAEDIAAPPEPPKPGARC